MVVIEHLESGEDDPRRQIASAKLKHILADIQSKYPTREEQFHGLTEIFGVRADCMLRSLENFDYKNYSARFAGRTQKDKEMLLEAAHVQFLVLEGLKDYMNDPVLLGFNGNAFDFEKCCKRAKEERIRLNTSIEVHINNGHLAPETAETIEYLLQKLGRREIDCLPPIVPPSPAPNHEAA